MKRPLSDALSTVNTTFRAAHPTTGKVPLHHTMQPLLGLSQGGCYQYMLAQPRQKSYKIAPKALHSCTLSWYTNRPKNFRPFHRLWFPGLL